MKTVFTSNEIAHVWAHKLAPYGKSPSAMRFDGPSFWSYGTEIARLCEHKGKQWVLLNDTSYSVTTSGHQSNVRGSIPHETPRFYLGSIGRGCSLDRLDNGKTLFEYQIKLATDAKARADKANRVNKVKHLARVSECLAEAQRIADFFGLRRKVDTKAIDRHAAKIAAEQKRQAKAAKEAQARYEREQAENVTKWLAGEPVSFPYGVQRVYLRLKPQMDVSSEAVETSKGVRIPPADAERAFRFAIARRLKGWHRNGETFQVGQYQLDAINENGIVAGCHRIDWQEIERFANLMGWTTATLAES